MITPKHKEVMRIFNLIRHHQTDAFEWLPTSIHIITKKQVALLGWRSDELKDTKKISVLTMNITADIDGRL